MHLRLLPLPLLFAIAIGCTPQPRPSSDSSPATAAAAKTTTSPPSEAPQQPPLVLASWAETEQLIAKQQGKVVVVDFWSTWCSPCVREFPQLVKIHEQYHGNVACLSVNCNYSGAADESASDAREEVLNFLTMKKAHFTNVLCTDADLELLEKIKAAAVPVVRVYDRQGKLRKQFSNDDGEYGDEGFEYEKHIVPLIESLLAE